MRIGTHNITREKILDYLLLNLVSHNKSLVGRCRRSVIRVHVEELFCDATLSSRTQIEV
jgi:hypothetical protein